ncbi:uncharacterized protein AB675_2877 [Cyphellophora attinorum]|uniref:Uncharacterized protein n=1 Tax=Cyphellophora attinorum TaxID=1664694 RepID=A0A0N1I0D1_9EURO|nr:uncharacterized protein AB675_2877 [Phialophora attinorum]KPI44903.1 hypothetical protein AB675_2877 [Phialophora attinorum]
MAQEVPHRSGQDLAGNTFWEMKDALNAERWRRMVRYTKRTHMGDATVSPQWHQWLRHTRDEPPSIHEQAADITRQSQLKHNAALADARWAAKARYIEKPQAPTPQIGAGLNPLDSGRARAAQDQQSTAEKTAINPGSDYQPDSWTPGPTAR